MRLECGGGPHLPDGRNCPNPPRFATWCDCPCGDGSLACALFFFCADCLELDLERDPADVVLELELEERHELGVGDVLAEIRLRPRP